MITFRSGTVFCRWLIAGWLCGTGLAQGATLLVSPSSVSNTYAGRIALQVGGLASGQTAVVDKYLDVNTNGVVDGTDWLVQSFRLTDGQANVIGGVTNVNVPYDSNPTNGAITANVKFQSVGIGQTLVGKYLYKVSSPTGGGFAAVTNAFTVTNTPYGQWFTGTVKCGSTNIPYAGVLVFPPPSEDGGGGPLAGTVANGSGTYTIRVAPGTYQLWAFKSNYVCNVSAAPVLTVNANTPVTTNLNVIPAPRRISGRFVDATNASVGVPGILTVMQSTNDLIAIGFSATNGNFSVPVTASGWQVGLDDQQLALNGYLSSRDGISVDTTTGSVVGVTVPIPKGTALVYGTVKDDQNHPMVGVSINADDSTRQYESAGTTDTNGNYVMAVLAGAWHMEPSRDDPAYASYLFSGTDATITNGQAMRVDFTGIKATTVSGRVRGDGSPLEGFSVQVGAITFHGGGNWDWQQCYFADTDANGNYSVMLPPGTNYYSQVNIPQGSTWLSQFYSNAMRTADATVIAALTNVPATNINYNLQRGAVISGRVLGGGDPLADMDVKAEVVTFRDDGGWDSEDKGYARTDTNGYYIMVVPPGTNLTVVANDYNPGSLWLSQFYSNATDAAGATVIPALTNAPATNINFNLQQGAMISGRVLADGLPLENADIQVGLIGTNEWGWWQWQHVSSVRTDTNGDYAITVSAGIAYAVEFMSMEGTTWLRQYYSNAWDEAHATLVTPLTNAPATHVDFVLHHGAVISGRVLGEGVPLTDTWVQVGLLSTNEWGDWQWEYMNSARTDNQGDYSVIMPSGLAYAVEYMPQGGDSWMRQFYNHSSDEDGATLVTPLIGVSATNIDFNLLSGVDANYNDVPDAWETQHFGGLGWMSDDSDWDEDGSSDLSEYWAGTNPTNNVSFLGVVGNEVRTSGAAFIIRWSSVAGKTYRIERATNLMAGFNANVKTGITATPTMNTETDTTAGVEGPVFYRVRLETP
jgi:uncharacterized GH25 family protein